MKTIVIENHIFKISNKDFKTIHDAEHDDLYDVLSKIWDKYEPKGTVDGVFHF